MYDINLKNVKKGKNIFYIFFVAGAFFAILLIFLGINNIQKKNSLDAFTNATRIDVKEHYDSDDGTMYSPVYYYEVDGKEYSCSSNSSSSIYPDLNKKTVYYDSKNPQRCMTEYSSESGILFFAFTLLPLLFIVIAIINIMKINKRIKKINQLNQTGKLVKNLPYYLENTGVVINGNPIRRPVVNYTLPNGGTILLRGDGRNDGRLFDADGLVDILIDEANPENYYIDLEINRLTGNLDSDYYMGNRNPVPQGAPMETAPWGQFPLRNTFPPAPVTDQYGQPIPNNTYGQTPVNNPYNSNYGSGYGQPPMNNQQNNGDNFYVDYGNKQ